MLVRAAVVILALGATLIAPFILRPREEVFSGKPDRTVVVITPHHEAICSEFGRAFSRHMKAKTGQNIAVDWRVPGGTAEVAKMLDSEFRAAFENYWKNVLERPWSEQLGDAFANPRLEVPDDPAQRTPEQEARAAFLQSDVGAGIDLFFGGGPYDFDRQADSGQVVATDGTGQFGVAGVARRHPDWFSGDVIPAEVSGERFYDPELRWAGTCLSSFGICYNRDSLERLQIRSEPDAWEDLGDPMLFGQVALADPTKSGSVTKAFEMVLQQTIQEAIDAAEAKPRPNRTPEEIRSDAIGQGWIDGLRLIQRIAANARYFTDDATKIPRDVAAGEAAAGMCIDFYGRTYNELVFKSNGYSRVGYVTPVGGSATSVDPIAMLRGAPNPELATEFIEFVLSRDGQKLWNYRVGEPGGPERTALRRLPIRKDLYQPQFLAHFSDPGVLPYETADRFVYKPEFTADSFSAIRFIIRVMCLDTHDELTEAWETLIETGFPKRATAMFHDVGLVNHDAAAGRVSAILRSGDRLREVHLARDLADLFRRSYRNTIDMARRGE